jgi:hypothetical protein
VRKSAKTSSDKSTRIHTLQVTWTLRIPNSYIKGSVIRVFLTFFLCPGSQIEIFWGSFLRTKKPEKMCLHDCLGKANTETKMLLNGCKNYSYIILQWSQEELWDCLCLFFDLLLSLTIQMSYFSLSGTNITAVMCNRKG